MEPENPFDPTKRIPAELLNPSSVAVFFPRAFLAIASEHATALNVSVTSGVKLFGVSKVLLLALQCVFKRLDPAELAERAEREAGSTMVVPALERVFTMDDCRMLARMSWRSRYEQERVTYRIEFKAEDWLRSLREKVMAMRVFQEHSELFPDGESPRGSSNAWVSRKKSPLRQNLGIGVLSWWLLTVLGPLESWGMSIPEIGAWLEKQRIRGLQNEENLARTAARPRKKRRSTYYDKNLPPRPKPAPFEYDPPPLENFGASEEAGEA